MSGLAGRWTLIMRTPVGRIRAEMVFGEDGHGFTGTAAAGAETVPLRDIRSSIVGGVEHVTWTQSIRKPMRLDLDFEVELVGDGMHGHSRAGRLPRSTVFGERITESSER